MKKTILRLMLSGALLAGLCLAQPKHGGKFMQDLNLTAEQKPQVAAIMKEQRAAFQQARQNNASKEDMQAIRKQTRDKLSSVLTAEQMQKFDAARHHRRNQGAPPPKA